MITGVLVGEREVIARLQSFPRSLHAVLLSRISRLVFQLKARVQRKLSGEVLNVRSGALRRSIQGETLDLTSEIIGRVFSTGDVKYAGIHEHGGKTRPHIIMPRNASVLAFAGAQRSFSFMGPRAGIIFAKVVHHPGSKMPERSFMRSSMAEMRQEIINSLTQGVMESAISGGSR